VDSKVEVGLLCVPAPLRENLSVATRVEREKKSTVKPSTPVMLSGARPAFGRAERSIPLVPMKFRRDRDPSLRGPEPGSPASPPLACWGGRAGVPSKPASGLLGWRAAAPLRVTFVTAILSHVRPPAIPRRAAILSFSARRSKGLPGAARRASACRRVQSLRDHQRGSKSFPGAGRQTLGALLIGDDPGKKGQQ